MGEADAKVSGTAVLVSDAGAVSAFRSWLKSGRGVEPLDWGLFTIDIDALTVISVDKGQLLVDRVDDDRGPPDDASSMSPAAALGRSSLVRDVRERRSHRQLRPSPTAG